MLAADFVEHRRAEFRVVPALLNPTANLRQSRFPVNGVVYEAVLFDRRGDALFQVVRANELLIVMERDGKARRDDHARQSRVKNLSEVRGLRAEPPRVARALIFEVRKPVVIEVGFRRDHVGALHPLALARLDLAHVGGRKPVLAFADFEPHVFAFKLFEKPVRVLDVGVRYRP